MKATIEGIVFDTGKAKLVGHNRVWNGNSWMQHNSNVYLYRDKSRRYFVYRTTAFPALDSIERVTKEEALALFKRHRLTTAPLFTLAKLDQ